MRQKKEPNILEIFLIILSNEIQGEKPGRRFSMSIAHPLINCGHETRILPRFLDLIKLKLYPDLLKTDDAGITKDKLDNASRSFILNIILSQDGISNPISPYI